MIKKLENNKKDNNNETMKGAAIILLFLIEVFWIIFYSVLGTKIGTNEAIVMSVLQVFTCLWNIAILMKEVPNAFSYNINDHKFHRFQLLFNLVLDYIYYPYAI